MLNWTSTIQQQQEKIVEQKKNLAFAFSIVVSIHYTEYMELFVLQSERFEGHLHRHGITHSVIFIEQEAYLLQALYRDTGYSSSISPSTVANIVLLMGKYFSNTLYLVLVVAEAQKKGNFMKLSLQITSKMSEILEKSFPHLKVPKKLAENARFVLRLQLQLQQNSCRIVVVVLEDGGMN